MANKEINIDEEVSDFSVNNDSLLIKAGLWQILVRDPPLVLSHRTPRRLSYIIGGIIVLLIGGFILFLGGTAFSAPTALFFGGAAVVFLGGIIAIVGLVMIIIGVRTEAVLTLETRTGVILNIRANSYMANKIVDEVLKAQGKKEES